MAQSDDFKAKAKTRTKESVRLEVARRLKKDKWDVVKGLNPQAPDNPDDKLLLELADELIKKRTLYGKALPPKDLEEVPTEAQIEAIAEETGEAVRENSGDTEFLGGATWGNAIMGFIMGLIKWIGSLFSGEETGGFMACITSSIKGLTADNMQSGVRERLTALSQQPGFGKLLTPETITGAVEEIGKAVRSENGLDDNTPPSLKDVPVKKKGPVTLGEVKHDKNKKPEENLGNAYEAVMDGFIRELPAEAQADVKKAKPDLVKAAVAYTQTEKGKAELDKGGADFKNGLMFDVFQSLAKQDAFKKALADAKVDASKIKTPEDLIKLGDKEAVVKVALTNLNAVLDAGMPAIKRAATGKELSAEEARKLAEAAKASSAAAKRDTQTAVRTQLTTEITGVIAKAIDEAAEAERATVKEGAKLGFTWDSVQKNAIAAVTPSSLEDAKRDGHTFNDRQKNETARVVAEAMRDVTLDPANKALFESNNRAAIATKMNARITSALRDNTVRINGLGNPAQKVLLVDVPKAFKMEEKHIEKIAKTVAAFVNSDEKLKDKNGNQTKEAVFEKLKGAAKIFHDNAVTLSSNTGARPDLDRMLESGVRNDTPTVVTYNGIPPRTPVVAAEANPFARLVDQNQTLGA